MMNCFPLLYEDELFYSIIARYRRMCGITSGKALIKDLFGEEVTLSSAYFPTHLKSFIENLPYSSKITENLILEHHTLYPFFTSFLSDVKTKDIYNSVIEGKGQRIILKMGMADNDVSMNKHLRFCPECFKGDLNILGESYWRRLHQIPAILYCIKHKCKILESSVMSVNARNLQECADENTCLTIGDATCIEDRLIKLNIELGEQVSILLDRMVESKDLSFIIDFYIDRLREVGLTSSSGNIYIKELEREFVNFYTMDYLRILQVDFEEGKNNNWLRLFVRNNNKNRNPIKHLLFLQFLGIKVDTLFQCEKVIGRKKVEIKHKPSLNKEDMREKWLNIIEENPTASISDLKRIGKGVYTWLYRHDRDWHQQSMPNKRFKKGNINFIDWVERDSECLELSQQAVQEIFKYEGKPIRICKSTIRRHLGLNTWFNNKKLIKTHEYISKIEEDIKSYRIRKIKWAIEEMTKQDENITPYKVQLYAGFGGNTKEVKPLIEKELCDIGMDKT